jgi:hypothetical protein
MQRSRFGFPALPDFLGSSGFGTGFTQLVSITEELFEQKNSSSGSVKSRLTAMGIRCTDHRTPLYPQKSALTLPTRGGRSVDIVYWRAKATEFFFYVARSKESCNFNLEVTDVV